MKMKDKKLQIGVIGDSEIRSKYQFEIAFEIGKEIANANAILICGGRGGVMSAAAKFQRIYIGVEIQLSL
jgi:uncharacterized protein (TIGR00725 family)